MTTKKKIDWNQFVGPGIFILGIAGFLLYAELVERPQNFAAYEAPCIKGETVACFYSVRGRRDDWAVKYLADYKKATGKDLPKTIQVPLSR